MKYAMGLASVGALLFSAPASAAPPHNGHGSRTGGDWDRPELVSLLDHEMHGILHNPHCDPDDQNGPDGDHDDKAAHNPGRGRHVGRCVGHPASP